MRDQHTITRDKNFVGPGAHYELVCIAITECLALAKAMSRGSVQETASIDTPFLISCARGIQQDAGMSDTEYDSLLAAAVFQ